MSDPFARLGDRERDALERTGMPSWTEPMLATLTTEQRKNRREGRLYLDVARNAYGQASVMPYSLRAEPGAPVATPLGWDELARGDLHAQSYTLKNLLRRLGQKDDPWSDFRRHAKWIGAGRTPLEKLTEEERA